MKSTKSIVSSLSIAILLSISSCGPSEMEKDGKRMADLRCQMYKLALETNKFVQKNPEDHEGNKKYLEISGKKHSALQIQIDSLTKILEAKYSSEEDRKKLGKIMLEEGAGCTI